MNKINVNNLFPFITAENELKNALEALKIGNHGKARVCARRAVGHVTKLYLQKHEDLFPLYGNSFMNNIRGIASDENIPVEIRNYAKKLIIHTGTDEINGREAIDYATKIINYMSAETQDK